MRRHPGRSLAAAAALVAATAVPVGLVSAAAPAQASSPAKDVTANLFMWNWTSVASECTNVLGPDGYAAVQVAPPEDSMTDAADGHPWWEIYQPVDYNLTSRMGNDAQFQTMVTACHQAGVKVYVDAVLNHMARQDGNDTSYGGVSYTPGSSYPAYLSADFHNYPNDCPVSSDQITDWNNYQQVTECELDSLPDLRTESAHVRTTEAAYLNKLIGYGVDGFRLDAAKHIGHTDLAALEALLNKDTTTGQPVYIVQEVALGSTNTQLQPDSFENTGSLIGFDYADAIKTQFTGDITNFGGFSTWSLIPSQYSSTFVNNHDTERDGSNLSYKNGATYVLATEFLLAWGFGTPQVYASFTWNNTNDSPPSDANGYVTNTNCNSGWYCTDRITGVANMVAWHNLALANGDPVTNWYTDGTNLIAFSRGPDAWIALNNESSAQTRTFTTGLPDGTYCDIIHGSVSGGACTGSTVTVSGNRAAVTVPANDAVAIDRNSRVPGPPATTFTVNVNANATTTWGQNVYIVGSIPALGSWNTANAVALSSQNYPSWTAALSLPTNTYFEYKYIKIDGSGNVTWESGNNRYYTTGSSGSITFNDTWHS
ncbi:MAG TPA: carbohydrate-binding module family 20 domain-containing protein [Actinocrinis sp.]|uniref:carbohydrate-binding module family 20 domain-containing protein n=1 Tax=Actinocrinis sp. TaxID=1920516 RepID=UPI002DDDB0A1|nr:carbohydrate-binding module family 20 domain-containing protein [Actinocrinis sp.]HEV3172997.1 carbohydrate-binding module family 20 domain-containing protein [Actinocrinis sp.]